MWWLHLSRTFQLTTVTTIITIINHRYRDLNITTREAATKSC